MISSSMNRSVSSLNFGGLFNSKVKIETKGRNRFLSDSAREYHAESQIQKLKVHIQVTCNDVEKMNQMNDLEKNVFELLVPIFPNLSRDVVETSVKHPSNHCVPLTADNLLQRCIDDLLELRTFTEKTALSHRQPAVIHSDDSSDSERDTSNEDHTSIDVKVGVKSVKGTKNTPIKGLSATKPSAEVEITGHTPPKEVILVSETMKNKENKTPKSTTNPIKLFSGNKTVDVKNVLKKDPPGCSSDNLNSSSNDMYREIDFSSDSNSNDSHKLLKLDSEESDDDLPSLSSPARPLKPSNLTLSNQKVQPPPDFSNWRDTLHKSRSTSSVVDVDKSILDGRNELLTRSQTVPKNLNNDTITPCSPNHTMANNQGVTATVNVSRDSMNVNITVNVSGQSGSKKQSENQMKPKTKSEVPKYSQASSSSQPGPSCVYNSPTVNLKRPHTGVPLPTMPQMPVLPQMPNMQSVTIPPYTPPLPMVSGPYPWLTRAPTPPTQAVPNQGLSVTYPKPSDPLKMKITTVGPPVTSSLHIVHGAVGTSAGTSQARAQGTSGSHPTTAQQKIQGGTASLLQSTSQPRAQGATGVHSSTSQSTPGFPHVNPSTSVVPGINIKPRPKVAQVTSTITRPIEAPPQVGANTNYRPQIPQPSTSQTRQTQGNPETQFHAVAALNEIQSNILENNMKKQKAMEAKLAVHRLRLEQKKRRQELLKQELINRYNNRKNQAGPSSTVSQSHVKATKADVIVAPGQSINAGTPPVLHQMVRTPVNQQPVLPPVPAATVEIKTTIQQPVNRNPAPMQNPGGVRIPIPREPVIIPEDDPFNEPLIIPEDGVFDDPVVIPAEGPVVIPPEGPVVIPPEGPVVIPAEGPVNAPVIPEEETLEMRTRKAKDNLRKEMMMMFPDVCPNFVDTLYDRFQDYNFQVMINNACNVLLEDPTYPRKTATTVNKPPEQQVKPSVDFYKEYSNYPDRIYCNQSENLLMAEFKWISMKDLRKVMSLYNHHYAPCHKVLESAMKQRAEEYSKSGQPPSGHPYSQAKVDVIVNYMTGDRNLTFNFLKCGRPSRSIGPLCPELVLEKEFIKMKEKEETKEQDHRLALSVNEHEYEESGQLIECGCCYGEVAFEMMIQCYDGHLFCQDCLQRYAQESVFGHGKADLSCMTDGCEASYPISQLQKALPSNILSKYEDRVQEENINLADLDDLVRCPSCDFAALMDPDDKVFKCQNMTCLKETCRYCKEDWKEHFGKRCDEIEQKDEVKLRLQFEEKMTEAKIRTCHKCKAKFTKSDGCNKMTCRCGAKMCYICRQPNIDYDHFCRHFRDPNKGKTCSECTACSLWTNPEQDDERAVQEIRKEAEETRKAMGYTDDKLIGAPDEPPNKKARIAPPERPVAV